jgi:predicted amidohydrolase
VDRSAVAPPFQIAVIQHAPVFLNLEACLDRAQTLVAEATGQGAQVVVFPETWLPGYPVWLDYAPEAALWDHAPARALYRLLVENSMVVAGRHFDHLLSIARKNGVHLVVGAHERLGGSLYNTMILAHRDGQTFQIHRKLVPTYTERLIWGRGDGSTLSVLPTEHGNLGGLICWEHWMPLARTAMHAMGETLHIAQWPAVKELHQLASRHYAYEGQCFVAAAGSILSRGDVLDGFDSLERPPAEARQLLEAIPGNAGSLLLRGGSAVIAPDAGYIQEPVFDRPCIVHAEIQPQLIAEGHLVLDTQGHYARPDVFSLHVDDRPQSGVSFTSHRRPQRRPQPQED